MFYFSVLSTLSIRFRHQKHVFQGMVSLYHRYSNKTSSMAVGDVHSTTISTSPTWFTCQPRRMATGQGAEANTHCKLAILAYLLKSSFSHLSRNKNILYGPNPG